MRCPVCKADNSQGPQCRRCKADLSLLFALEEQRRRTLSEAQRRLLEGEWRAAVKHAATASWLRQDEVSLRLTSLGYLLSRDFAAAWWFFQNWRAARGSAAE